MTSVPVFNLPALPESLRWVNYLADGETPFDEFPGALKVLHWIAGPEDRASLDLVMDLATIAGPDFEMALITGSDNIPGRDGHLAHLRPDIVHVHGDSDVPGWLIALDAPAIIRNHPDRDARSLLLHYEREYDDRVTRFESVPVRLAGRFSKLVASLPVVQDMPFRLGPIEAARIHLYKRNIYRDWARARWELPQKWLVAIPVLHADPENLLKWIQDLSAKVPPNWQVEPLFLIASEGTGPVRHVSLRLPELGFEAVMQRIGEYSMVNGHTLATLVNPEALPSIDDAVARVEALFAGEPSAVIKGPACQGYPLDLTWWPFRFVAQVDAFEPSPALWRDRLSVSDSGPEAGPAPDLAGDAQVRWREFMELGLAERPERDVGLTVSRDHDFDALPRNKTIVVLEPHSDDAFLGMGVTIQRLIRRNNRVVILGLIRENMPGPILASGLSPDPHRIGAQRDAVRRREGRRAAEALYQAVVEKTEASTPVGYEVLELGMGKGSGGNRQLGYTVFELHMPGAVSQSAQDRLLETIEGYRPDILVGIDAFDSHPDHAIAGRLTTRVARKMAQRRGVDLPVWLYRGFSNRRADFGKLASLAVVVSREESAAKQAMGVEAFYSQKATFSSLYDTRMRTRWWERDLANRCDSSMGEAAEVEAFIRFRVSPTEDAMIESKPSTRARVDVIVPFYNTPMQYVRPMIDSVLKQTFTDWRLVIVNDGSSEESSGEIEALLNELAEPRISYVRQTNTGLAGARNAGIRHSSADYVAFLDSDDLFYPCRLERQVEFLERNPEVCVVHSDCDILSGDGKFIDPEPELDERVNSMPLRDVSYLMMRKNPIAGVNSVMFRRRELEEVGLFDETFKSVEDKELYLRFMCRGHRLVYLPGKVSSYRWHDSNMSKNVKHMLSGRLQLVTKLDQLVAETPGWLDERWPAARKQLRRHAYYEAASTAYYEVEAYWSAIRYGLPWYSGFTPSSLKLILKSIVKAFLRWRSKPPEIVNAVVAVHLPEYCIVLL